MKKLTLILAGIIAFSLCTASLFAAESGDVKKRYFGAVIGFNFAQFIGENSDAAEFYGGGDKSSRKNIAVGAFAHLGIGNILAIEPQVLYSRKGSRYADFDPALNDEFTIIVDYLEVPVFVRVYIPPIPVVKVNVFGGGYFGYKIMDRYHYIETGYEEDGDFAVHPEDFDYGLVFGAGVAYPTRIVIVRVDLKYSLGLAKIWDLPPDDDVRNGVLSIIASVSFW